MSDSLGRIRDEVIACRACPRLVDWRERAAREKVARFADQEYWGRPVPGFGDPAAEILILGLAPAAHGGNRTGRVFTGDRSGDFLFASLHRTGFANQPVSVARDDGLRLDGVHITAVNKCAPPANKPTPEERDRCLPYLEREIRSLTRLKVIVALGAYAWDGASSAVRPSRRGAGRPIHPRRLLPPESAEHVHRQAHRSDAGRSVRTRARGSLALIFLVAFQPDEAAEQRRQAHPTCDRELERNPTFLDEATSSKA